MVEGFRWAEAMEAEEKKTQWFIGSLEQWPLNVRANAHRLAGKKQKVNENCVPGSRLNTREPYDRHSSRLSPIEVPDGQMLA